MPARGCARYAWLWLLAVGLSACAGHAPVPTPPPTALPEASAGRDSVAAKAQPVRLSPSLVAGVLLIENTPMDTAAVSRAGAVGLMQVMPFHAGNPGCG